MATCNVQAETAVAHSFPYALLDWNGANSFRTSHYPYSEEMLMLADRLGYLVVAEASAVGLFFAEAGLAQRGELCRQFTQALIARDRQPKLAAH
jgi:beta-glucuronidase